MHLNSVSCLSVTYNSSFVRMLNVEDDIYKKTVNILKISDQLLEWNWPGISNKAWLELACKQICGIVGWELKSCGYIGQELYVT